MFIFDQPDFDQHERVGVFHDQDTGLKAIIAIHSTVRGPALGGCRMWNYDSENDAIQDVLRLSRGMTYKAALADVPLGGGKSVIIGDARTEKTPELMRAMGRAVQQMAGDYIIAEDVGTSVEDLVEVSKETDYAVGLPAKEGQSGGDPSPITAYGVFLGLKAAVKSKHDTDDLSGIKVAVQGLGSVGYTLAKHVHEAGGKLFVTDINTEAVDRAVSELGATAVGLDEVYDLDVDVYAPCALGATLNDETLERLKVSVIAGAANNQLAEMRHADAMRDLGMLYAPDYVINAGGLINVYYEYNARVSNSVYDYETVMKEVEKIYDTTLHIFDRAAKDDITTALAADRIAEDRFKNQQGKSQIAA